MAASTSIVAPQRPQPSLHLKPWQVCPCDVTADNFVHDHGCGGQAALTLVDKMQRLGISRWHPDPVAVISEAERKAAAP